MTNGASQGLFVIVAVVIFGIFVLISYLLFGDKLKTSLGAIFDDSISQAEFVVSNPELKDAKLNVEYRTDIGDDSSGSSFETAYNGTLNIKKTMDFNGTDKTFHFLTFTTLVTSDKDIRITNVVGTITDKNGNRPLSVAAGNAVVTEGGKKVAFNIVDSYLVEQGSGNTYNFKATIYLSNGTESVIENNFTFVD